MKARTGAECLSFSISTFTKCEVNRNVKKKTPWELKQVFIEKYSSSLGKDVHRFTGSMKSWNELIKPGDLVV